MLFSCDSKAKIHIGGQAVSRYHQVRNFFPAEDMPHYADHDFPIPNYLIEPDGYLLLQSKSQTPVMTNDKLGRNVVEVPMTGPMWIYNRCEHINTSTHQRHIKHINDDVEHINIKSTSTSSTSTSTSTSKTHQHININICDVEHINALRITHQRHSDDTGSKPGDEKASVCCDHRWRTRLDAKVEH